jgi:hypothetical protein
MDTLPPELVQAVSDRAGAAGLTMRRVCKAWNKALPWEWVAANYSWPLAAEAGAAAVRRRARLAAPDRAEMERALAEATKKERWDVVALLGELALEWTGQGGAWSYVMLALAARGAPAAAEELMRKAAAGAAAAHAAGNGKETARAAGLTEVLAERLEMERRRCAPLDCEAWAPPLLAARLKMLAGERVAGLARLLAAPEAWFYPELAEACGAAPDWDAPARQASLPMRAERWAARAADSEWPERAAGELLWEMEHADEDVQRAALAALAAGMEEVGASVSSWRRAAKLAAAAGSEAELRTALERARPTAKLYEEWIEAAAAADKGTAVLLLKHAAARTGDGARLRTAATRKAIEASSGRVLEQLSRGYRTHCVRRELQRAEPLAEGRRARFEKALEGGAPGVARAIHRAFPEERAALERAAADVGARAKDLCASGWRLVHELGGTRKGPDWARAGRLSGRERNRPLLWLLQSEAPAAEWFGAAAAETLAALSVRGVSEQDEKYVAALLETGPEGLDVPARGAFAALVVWLLPAAAAAEALRAACGGGLRCALSAALFATGDLEVREKVVALLLGLGERE